jgi:hypothetical protein
MGQLSNFIHIQPRLLLTIKKTLLKVEIVKNFL